MDRGLSNFSGLLVAWLIRMANVNINNIFSKLDLWKLVCLHRVVSNWTFSSTTTTTYTITRTQVWWTGLRQRLVQRSQTWGNLNWKHWSDDENTTVLRTYHLTANTYNTMHTFLCLLCISCVWISVSGSFLLSQIKYISFVLAVNVKTSFGYD